MTIQKGLEFDRRRLEALEVVAAAADRVVELEMEGKLTWEATTNLSSALAALSIGGEE